MAGVCYRTPDGVERTAYGHLTVACDGIYSTLRTKLSTPSIKTPSYFVGLLLRGCKLPYECYGHVVLAKPSPVLFYPISSTEVRCLVDYPGASPVGAAGFGRHAFEDAGEHATTYGSPCVGFEERFVPANGQSQVQPACALGIGVE